MGALADITVPRWFPIGSEFREGGRRETFVHEMISNTSVEGFASSAASLQGYDVLPNLATSIKGKKVLLMVGERDGVLPVTMKKLSQDIGAEFEVVLGAGHLPMVDQPAAFLDIVEKFLSS
jgi:pimeloyl-ACP methyl ester carboxylesterase